MTIPKIKNSYLITKPISIYLTSTKAKLLE